ncbi:type VII secretion protein EccE [Streptomyces harbinensis]|uniref:Type VII secretion protein EccE n=1 Tax=Streptomyces harbinensis TaxID=1176198 RepID=A0A1I6VWK4_9ACTN|nr:type VII secretion protein EccE [Streptomyces harbinensis]SFT18100.1 type VII secretion protein EccE [Streptomyces harbinensis]
MTTTVTAAHSTAPDAASREPVSAPGRPPVADRGTRAASGAAGAASGPGLVVWPLVCVQAALALVLGAWAADSPVLLAAAAPPAAALVLIAVARRRGRPLPVWAAAVRRLRRRRRRAVGPLPSGVDPLLSLAAECEPGLRSYAVQRSKAAGGAGSGALGSSWAGDVGMAGDGSRLTAVLRVEAPRAPLQPGRDGSPLPLALLADALETDGIVLDSVQCVQHTQPAPAPQLPDQAIAGRNYAQLLGTAAQGGHAPAPGLRLTWVALRLDPERCRAAVAERGGGLRGAQRALTRAADQLASRLTGAGFRTTVLSEAELLSAVAACVSSNPATTTLIGQGDGPRPRRTAESTRGWRCDDRWHTTFEVSRWPEPGAGSVPLPALVAALTSGPAFATTFALTLRRHGADAVSMAGHVRVTGRGEEHLRAAGEALLHTARGVRVGLARMDYEQLRGVRATLPLGGGH